MNSEPDLKNAAIKYLLDEWGEAEEEQLKTLRYAIASELVPKAFGRSRKKTNIDYIHEYVKLFTESPDSEEGKEARVYLSSLATAEQSSDKGGLGDIVETAKLHCISINFLQGKAKVSDRTLNYKNGYLELGNGKAKISKKMYWNQFKDMVPDPKDMYAFWPNFPSGLVFSGVGDNHLLDLSANRGLWTPVTTELDQNQAVEAVINNLRQEAMARFEAAAEQQRGGEVSVPIRFHPVTFAVIFDEGTLMPESYNRAMERVYTLTLHKYTPRAGRILDKILS